MKFTKNKAFEFGWEGLRGWSYNSKEDFSNLSAAYFEVTGKHGKVKTTKSDRIYYVLDGEGQFEIEDKIISVKKTDVIIIPKNTSYDYWVKTKGEMMKLYLVHSPTFDSESEVGLE